MQPELERWIQERQIMRYQQMVLPVSDLRALLEGKVIADPDPVAWMDETGDIVPHSVYMDNGMTGRAPLYKAAGVGD